MDPNQLLESKIRDRIRQSREGFYITTTGFLNLHEQSSALPLMREAKDLLTFFYGGYEDAERRMLIIAPKELAETPEDALAMGDYIRVIEVDAVKGGRPLTHRDYLGSMLGLGIDRSVTGDILVGENGADILAKPEIADFLLQEYHMVGHTDVRLREKSLDELALPEKKFQIVRDTLASLRLDNVLSSAFRISRNEAAKAIRTGLVFVDHAEMTKNDYRVDEGAVLILRGKGKARLREVGGESRKGRIWVEFERYV